MQTFGKLIQTFFTAATAVFFVWSCAALYIDGPAQWAVAVYAVAVGLLMWRMQKTRWTPALVPLAGAMLVLAWWLRLEPSHDRAWQAEWSRLPRAEVNGDTVTVRDVRDFDHSSAGAPVARWEAREVSLSDLEGIDLAVNYWGSPWMAHPIVIFRFGHAPPLAFSIETRREEGEAYSALAGLFRKYELIVVAGSERDLLGLRAVGRQGEDVYLYRTTVPPDQARSRFLEYLETVNALAARPRWYNALTSNCTTAIRTMRHGELPPFDWRLIVNGKGDEMLYERGDLAGDGLPFVDLKEHAHANAAIRGAYASPETFSEAIRRGRPGFGETP